MTSSSSLKKLWSCSVEECCRPELDWLATSAATGSTKHDIIIEEVMVIIGNDGRTTCKQGHDGWCCSCGLSRGTQSGAVCCLCCHVNRDMMVGVVVVDYLEGRSQEQCAARYAKLRGPENPISSKWKMDEDMVRVVYMCENAVRYNVFCVKK